MKEALKLEVQFSVGGESSLEDEMVSDLFFTFDGAKLPVSPANSVCAKLI